MRVLLVDDELSLRLTLAANLELEGLEVVEAASAEEALAFLDAQSFDIVLSDVRMPGLSGVELFERIRQRKPDLPVILMTAYAQEEQLEQALAGGIYTVLSKPFGIDQAVRALQRASTRPVVLVVDANATNAIASMLGAAGLRTECAGDMAEVLEAIRSGRVDVCIADLGSPESGRLLDDLAASGNVSVIAVAQGSDAASVTRLAPLVHQFLNKPVVARDLVGGVAKARRDRATS